MSDAGTRGFDGWTDGDLAAERARLAGARRLVLRRHLGELVPCTGKLVRVEDEIERRRVEAERATAAAIVEAEEQERLASAKASDGITPEYHGQAQATVIPPAGGIIVKLVTPGGVQVRSYALNPMAEQTRISPDLVGPFNIFIECGEDARGRAIWENFSDHRLAPDESAFMSESAHGPWWVYEAGRWSRRTEPPECMRAGA